MVGKEDSSVSLHHYQGGDDICLGRASNNTIVCSVHTSLCTFSSHVRKHSLHPGWYIKAPTRGGGSFFWSPYVPYEGGQDSEGFMEITEDAFSHARWVAIFDASGKGTFDDKEEFTPFILEEKTRSVDQKVPVNTLFKRPMFGLNNFDANTLDDGEMNKKQ